MQSRGRNHRAIVVTKPALIHRCPLWRRSRLDALREQLEGQRQLQARIRAKLDKTAPQVGCGWGRLVMGGRKRGMGE